MRVEAVHTEWANEAVFSKPPRTYGLLRAGIRLASRSTTHKGAVALADQTVVTATNLLTGIIIGRACTKEEFGVYLLGFSIVLFVLELQTSLVVSPFMVFGPRLTGSAYARYAGSTLIHQMALSALMVLILATAGTVLTLGAGPSYMAPVVWALAATVAFIMLRDYVRRTCFADLRMSTALVLDTYVLIIQTSGLLYLARTGILSASRAYIVIGAACAIVALSCLVATRKRFVPALADSLSHLKRNWSFGKWVFAGKTAVLMSHQLYPWILAAYHGTAATGVFAACWSIVAFMNPVRIGIENFLGPRTAHAYNQGTSELQRVVRKATIVLTVATGLFSLALLVFGNALILAMYGGKYVDCGGVILLLALGVVASTVTAPAGQALWVMERPSLNFRVNLIRLAVTLVMGIPLVKFFGPLGVALGLVVGNVAASTVRYILYRRVVRLMPRTPPQQDLTWQVETLPATVARGTPVPTCV
jgi:O-antigen/teichoic acid export membrane protein